MKMQSQTLVAVYATRAAAESARDKLISLGVRDADIRLSGDASEAVDYSATGKHEGQGFWDWLLGTEVPETDRDWYRSSMREGRTALSVWVADVDRSRIEAILDEYDPIEIGADTTASHTPTGAPTGQSEEHIPVIKEELDVGKRQTERRYRVRVYPVERPVEEQVTLRDETVVIERRPVSGQPYDGGADALKPRDLEVIERHEEPVVGKKARMTEEVVVHKDMKDRTETVRGKVRETKVEVDRPPQGRNVEK
jgi:stress response protein YsnF